MHFRTKLSLRLIPYLSVYLKHIHSPLINASVFAHQSSNHILDPCHESNQGTLYREKYRGTLCTHRIGKTTFDREITEKWYKVNGVDGPLSMPTEPVPIYHCSTQFPGWMNGRLTNVFIKLWGFYLVDIKISFHFVWFNHTIKHKILIRRHLT